MDKIHIKFNAKHNLFFTFAVCRIEIINDIVKHKIVCNKTRGNVITINWNCLHNAFNFTVLKEALVEWIKLKDLIMTGK